jgi:hypothetical protein
MPVTILHVEAGCIDNAAHLDYLTTKLQLEKPEIRSTDLNIPNDNNCTDNVRHFWIPAGSGDYTDKSDTTGEGKDIPTTSQPR